MWQGWLAVILLLLSLRLREVCWLSKPFGTNGRSGSNVLHIVVKIIFCLSKKGCYSSSSTLGFTVTASRISASIAAIL